MAPILPSIGILHDSRSQSIAETYLNLLKRSAYGHCPCKVSTFSLAQPERALRLINDRDALFVQVGIPGRDDYEKQLHGFLNIYRDAAHKPAIGLSSHDAAHTRYILDRWLTSAPQNADMLPDRALSIIDTSRPLRSASMDKALAILLRNSPVYQERTGNDLPQTRVLVDMLLKPGQYIPQPSETT